MKFKMIQVVLSLFDKGYLSDEQLANCFSEIEEMNSNTVLWKNR